MVVVVGIGYNVREREYIQLKFPKEELFSHSSASFNSQIWHHAYVYAKCCCVRDSRFIGQVLSEFTAAIK